MNARVFTLALLAVGLWAVPSGARAADDDEGCRDCHAALEGEFFTLANGDTLPAWVAPEDHFGSVHGDDIGCRDCHPTVGDHPHAPPAAADARTYRIQAAAVCTDCHFKHATALRDSMHYERLMNGDDGAPTCVDCHGGHGVQPAAVPRETVSDRCGACHEEQVRDWRASAHGQAVLAGNTDAPVCADCHGAHAITDPRLPTAHAASYAVCGRCHGDARMMGRHGLDPGVVDSYLRDFHGASNRIYEALGDAPADPVASCGDCHGVHTVQSFAGLSDDERAARAAAMCRDCHREATDDFATAWGSHTPPSQQHRPVVWIVGLVYKLMIPLMIVGLIAHILMDLWRTPGRDREEGYS